MSYRTILGALVLLGCGGALTYRDVDTPSGNVTTLGAPRDHTYSFEAEPELDVLRLRVYRAGRCDVIPTQVVIRRTETLQGGDVVYTENKGKVQIAKPPSGQAPCDVGYARDTAVSLLIGNAVHQLGTTDAYGQVAINLSQELREKLYGAGVPAEATVRLRPPQTLQPVDAGKLSLASLREHEAGVQKLLTEFEALLNKGSALTGAEITRSYTVYESLRAIGWYDPRVRAALARFWELLFQRKQVEATENMTRNLKALESAKELLTHASDASIPLFMQMAVNTQSYDPRAYDWSTGELFRAFRQKPEVCAGFDWVKVNSYGFPLSAQVAVQYLRFADGDAFFHSMSGVCGFAGR
jgi:hypothetical protein